MRARCTIYTNGLCLLHRLLGFRDVIEFLHSLITRLLDTRDALLELGGRILYVLFRLQSEGALGLGILYRIGFLHNAKRQWQQFAHAPLHHRPEVLVLGHQS